MIGSQGVEKFHAGVSVTPLNIRRIVVVIGTTGTGKSTIINMLLNNDFSKDSCDRPCSIGESAESVTKKHSWWVSCKHERMFADTMGFSDPDNPDIEVCVQLKKLIKAIEVGIHCVIIVVKYGRLSREERANLETMKALFNESFAKHCVLVLTHYDRGLSEHEKKQAINKWIGNDAQLKEFVSLIGNRIILTDNSLGMYEQISRPLRQDCLEKLNSIIEESDEPFNIAPETVLQVFITSLRKFLERFMSFEQASKTITELIEAIGAEEIHAGDECPICLQNIEVIDIGQTECHIIFRKGCIQQALDRNHNCPVCQQVCNTIYQTNFITQ